MKAILFDLDGTLLPMDQDVFTKEYFKALAKHLAPYGYDKDKVVKAMWDGINAMLNNDGSKTNEQSFWQAFSPAFGTDEFKDIALFDEFYATVFETLKVTCGYNGKAGRTIKQLKAQGYCVVVATNPVFPIAAYRARLKWAGVDIKDFEFITTYENSHFCKPQAGYYTEILKRLNLNADECLMVGNDVGDDMPALDVGMKVFLMTDYLINTKNQPIDIYPRGGFDELMEFIEQNR